MRDWGSGFQGWGQPPLAIHEPCYLKSPETRNSLSEVLTSYKLVNDTLYKPKQPIFHTDLYRVRRLEETVRKGLETPRTEWLAHCPPIFQGTSLTGTRYRTKELRSPLLKWINSNKYINMNQGIYVYIVHMYTYIKE